MLLTRVQDPHGGAFAVRAGLGPDADPAAVAAALARLYAHAPRGDELEAWLAEGLG